MDRSRERGNRGGSSLTLGILPEGAEAFIEAIPGNRGIMDKLIALGVLPGKRIRVISNKVSYPWSPVIVEVDGVEVALSRRIAAKVKVRTASNK